MRVLTMFPFRLRGVIGPSQREGNVGWSVMDSRRSADCFGWLLAFSAAKAQG